MKAPLSYLDLVIETVRGRSPVPEFQSYKSDRQALAASYLETLRSRYPSGKSGNEYIDFIMDSGPALLCNIWERLSPAALTMSGDKNIEVLVNSLKAVEEDKIPGDLIETGVWRGGLPLIMRAFLHSVGNKERKVWVADSFKGLPDNGIEPNDLAAFDLLKPIENLSVGRELVENAFSYFGLLDEQVKILEGWFSDTLKTMPKTPLAIIRLDGDFYESTKDALVELYPRLSPGGFLIIDDYNLPLGCKRAVDEYRAEHGITEDIQEINFQSVYWRKARS